MAKDIKLFELIEKLSTWDGFMYSLGKDEIWKQATELWFIF